MNPLEKLSIVSKELEKAASISRQYQTHIDHFVACANTSDSAGMDNDRQVIHVLVDSLLDSLAVIGMMKQK